MNQILLCSLFIDFSHVFVVLASLSNSFDDDNACTFCHQLEENGLSHSSCEEVGPIVQSIHKAIQIDLSLLITNWESNALINPSDHYSVSNDSHLAYHFPTSTSSESYFTSFELYGSMFHYLDIC